VVSSFRVCAIWVEYGGETEAETERNVLLDAKNERIHVSYVGSACTCWKK